MTDRGDADNSVVGARSERQLTRAGIPKALTEVARVLRPRGEFLLTIVNPDAWAWFASPFAVAHHRAPDASRWRALLESSGFDVVEHGTQPGGLYFFSRKKNLD